MNRAVGVVKNTNITKSYKIQEVVENNVPSRPKGTQHKKYSIDVIGDQITSQYSPQ